MLDDSTADNATSKLFNQEERCEVSEDTEKTSCVASECIFARWLKPTTVREMTFVSKDVLLIHVGKTLIFHNVRTQKIDLLTVGGNKSTPIGGDGLFLDGVGCVDCCGIDLLALAEQPPIAKLVVCRYPDFKVLETLVDNSNPAAYKSVLFLRLEYLIGLRDYPAFDLIVWAWRIKEKLLVVNTGFIQPDQRLCLSATTGRDVYLSQTELDVKCKLQLWTMAVSCKTVYAERTRVEVPNDVDIRSGCWTPSGWFVFCDSSMNVYRTQPGSPVPEMCVEYVSEHSSEAGGQRALICPSKQGFVLYTIHSLTSYKDTKGDFAKSWTIVINHALLCVVAGESDVYGWSDEGKLLELTAKKEQMLKAYGTNVKLFAFIKPTDETVATVNEKNVLQVWDVLTGKFKCETRLNGVATNLCSNPFYYYVAVSFRNGVVEMLKANPKANDLERITKIVLCDEQISSVHFSHDGRECVATSFPTGLFYRVSVELGQSCSVIGEYRLEKRVIDIEIIDGEKTSFLIVLYANGKTAENAGNNIVIFNKNFKDVFELKSIQHYYTSVFKRTSSRSPDLVNIAFTVMMSTRIHLMTINVLQAQVLNSEVVSFDHSVRNIKISAGENHFVTFSTDGTYNIYEFDDGGKWKKIVTVNCSHWQTGGLIAAQVDVNARNVLTLSRRGNFMCTSFKETCNHVRRTLNKTVTPIIMDNMETKGIGFDDGPGPSKRMTWTMIDRENKLNASKVAFSEQKNQIIRDFEEIKKELLTLFEINVNGPENTKINIEEFDLNVDHRLWFREKCAIERREYEEKILAEMNDLKIETENILKSHWTSLFVKPKSIHCLKKLYKVDNYPISIVDQEVIERANEIKKKRAENYEQENASFAGKRDNFETTDDGLFENDYKRSNDESLLGSISHRFGVTVKHLNSQYDYYKLEMSKDEIILLQYMINKLKHNFNSLFDDMFIEKQRQLDDLKTYNDRLRVIETEFRLACKIEPVEPSPVDYEWNEYEQTEKLIYVRDDEVPAAAAVVTSAHRILSRGKEEKLIDANSVAAKEERRNGRLLASDNFRQRALISMMDGVLEKRWEDELKKDVPRPPCMLNKTAVGDYTEEDRKAVEDYERLSAALQDERTKYKKILDEERANILVKIEKSTDEFDERVLELFKIKLKYNSAIGHESLKIVRLSKMLSDSERRRRQITLYRDANLEIEKTLTETIKKIAKTEATHGYLLNTIETLKHKNNVLNKRFKSEFPSKLIYEQALIAYNRRPKLQGNVNYSSLLGYQFYNTIMDPSDDKLQLLCSEFVKYLDTLRAYDDYKYVDDYKLNMDRETWHKVCNFRRIKIESEFKISTYQKDATDKANLLENLTRDKEDKETMCEQYKTSVVGLENRDLCYRDDPEIQLVLNQGHIEIKLTGHFNDFDNTSLVSKNSIDEVNDKIKEMGKIKIEVLSDLLKFKRKCQFLKWEHDILKKHKITLYKYRFDVITSMKVTENMLHYLKFKGKGINIAKQAEQKVERELAAIQITYSKEKTDLERNLNELVDKIRSVTKENEKTDKSIDQLNHNLSELKAKIDSSLTNKLKLYSDLRMKDIVKRAQMITNIQELHKEVFVLQTELELLLLKTFPTLYTTIPKHTGPRK